MNDQILQARKIIGLFIKQSREERNLTQAELAEKIGVKEYTIVKIEHGKFNFGIDLFNKLSIALAFKMEIILKDEENTKGRFDLIEQGPNFTVIDKETGIRVHFLKNLFNESQKVELPHNDFNTSDLATIMRLIGDWLYDNYQEVI